VRQSPRRTPDPQRICADSFPSLPWYDLRGVGSIRIGGLFSRAATAAVLDGKGWGKRPVKVTIDDPNAVDPGLLLFAVFVVRRLAEDAATVASSGSSATATG
jgi:hypothetical protein